MQKCGIIERSLNPSLTSSPKCFQCGSVLILVSKKTTHPEGSLFPQTASVYKCSNKACQDQKDKEELKRIKLREEKAELEKKKAEEKKQRHDEKIVAVLGGKADKVVKA